MKICDALVVGAGPAGARTARDLAAKGFHTILLEEHDAIGVPCHCSGLVTPRTLELAGVGRKLVLNEITGAHIRLSSGHSLRLTAKSVKALVIDRVELDRRLVAQAIQAGAELLTGYRFLSFQVEGDARSLKGAVIATVRQGDRVLNIPTRLLVGADGARSRVAATINPSHGQGRIRAFGGTAEYWANTSTDHVEVFLDEGSAPGWFAWTIPLGNGISRVGTGSANGLKPLESFQQMRKQFPESLGSANLLTKSAGAIPIWRPTEMVADRTMLVGDAARQTKPTSGGGIFTALASAHIAANCASRRLLGGDLSKRALSAYRKLWQRSIGSELQRQHDIRRALERLDQTGWVQILEELGKKGIKSTLERVGDVDFPSSLAWLGLRHFRILSKLAVLPEFPTAWSPARGWKIHT